MAILLESPWYQEIYSKGVQQGIQQGKQEGIQEGIQQGKQEGINSLKQNVMMILRYRFETVSDQVIEKLNQINSLTQLQDLSQRAITTNELGAFEECLNSLQTNQLDLNT